MITPSNGTTAPTGRSHGEPRLLMRSRRNRLRGLNSELEVLVKALSKKFGKPPCELTADENAQVCRARDRLYTKWGVCP